MSERSDKSRRIVEFVVLSVFLLFILLVIPKTMGLASSGFDTREILDQYFFYADAGMWLGIMLIFLYEFIIKDDDEEYGNGIGFSEIGETPALNIFKRFSAMQIFLLSFIFFSLLIFIASFLTPQQSFTGVPIVSQQFTPVNNIIFNTILVPLSENLENAFIIALVIFVIRIVARRKEINKANFIIFCILFSILFSVIFGIANHQLRYQNDETSLMIVGLFWGLGGLFTVLVGSFIPFWVMHIINNLIKDLKYFFSNDVGTYFALAIVIITVILYVLIYVNKKREYKSPYE